MPMIQSYLALKLVVTAKFNLLNIIFETPQGFFKADWFFGDWR